MPIEPGKEKGRGRSSGEPRSASQGVSPGESQTSAEGAERPLPMPSPCLAQRGEEGLGEEAEPSSPLCPSRASRASRARACSMGLGVYLKECILRSTS